MPHRGLSAIHGSALLAQGRALQSESLKAANSTKKLSTVHELKRTNTLMTFVSTSVKISSLAHISLYM